MNIKQIFKNALESTLALIFPIECLNCNREDFYLCDSCLEKIPVHHLAEPFEHPLTHLGGVLTATDYSDRLIQKIIHYFKFRLITELAEPLAKLIIKHLKLIDFDLSDYIVIPVPLNKKRLLERGFNQSELIAKIFADHFNLPMMADVVSRSRNTPHQVGLNKKQRQANIKNAFFVKNTELIENKNIILIDDVVTTGSTLEEIAKLLKQKGVKKIIGLAVAKD